MDSGGPQHIRVFDVAGASAPGQRPRLCQDAFRHADGIRCDEDGNVWAALAWAVDEDLGAHCFAPDGTHIGRIHLPEMCSNLCFGGLHKNRLFVTGGTSLYAVYLNTRGV